MAAFATRDVLRPGPRASVTMGFPSSRFSRYKEQTYHRTPSIFIQSNGGSRSIGFVRFYTRAFDDGLRNFEPRLSDEGDTRAGTPSSNYHTTPTGGHLSSRQI
ncbi:hypothetical protein TNCV_3266811 [Trichonephila clavipes]|nr:hypothetical protein TNCV_3266811 [Trichonephila clavipes]